MRLRANEGARGMARATYEASDTRASAHLLAFGPPLTPKTNPLYFYTKSELVRKTPHLFM